MASLPFDVLLEHGLQISLPERRSAQIIAPAARKTRFLNIYCPTNVNPKGVTVKQSCGNKNNGVKVKIICNIKIRTKNLTSTPVKNPTPINISQAAKSLIEILGAIKPNVNF